MPLGAFKLNSISKAASTVAESYWYMYNNATAFTSVSDISQIQIDSNKNIFVVTSSKVVYKINDSGVIQWQKQFTQGDAAVYYKSSLSIDSSNNPVFVTSNSYASGSQVIMSKLSTDTGAELNRSNLKASQSTNGVINLYDTFIDSSNNYYAIGTRYGADGAFAPANAHPVIFKYNSSLSYSAQGYYQINYNTSHGYNFYAANSSSMVVATYDGTTNQPHLTKYSLPSLTFTNAYRMSIKSATGTDFLYPGIHLTSGGDLYVVSPVRISKYNSSYTHQWTRTISSTIGNNTAYIEEDSLGNIYILGKSSGTELSILKVNSSGTLQWSRKLTFDSAATLKNYNRIKIKNDIMYIMSGTSTSGLIIVKLPINGTLTGNYGSGKVVYSTDTKTLSSSSDTVLYTVSNLNSITPSVVAGSLANTYSNTAIGNFTKTTV